MADDASLNSDSTGQSSPRVPLVQVKITFRGSSGLELGRQFLREVEAAIANLEAWRAGLGELTGFTEGCGTSVTVPDGVQVEIRIGTR